MTDQVSLSTFGIGRLFALVPDPVIIGDTESGTVVAWNDAAEATFGYTRAEATGMPIDLLVPEELRDAHRAGLATWGVGGGGHLVGAPELVELPAVCADGRRIWVELRLAALTSEDDSRRHVLAVLRDVTARRAAQDETRTALEEARAANAALRDFVDMVAHDVRAPVGGVRMAVELLNRQWDRLDPQQRDEISVGALKHADVALGLLDNLLQVSTIDSGQVLPHPERVPLAPLLADAAESAAVDIELDVSDGLAVTCDPEHLQRVLVNLLSNAQKYGEPPLDVSATASDAEVALTVRDHGPGVPVELQPVLFQKFTRGAATATSQQGTGLGLAIVAGLIETNGGTVSYADAPSGGSAFTLRLPRALAT